MPQNILFLCSFLLPTPYLLRFTLCENFPIHPSLTDGASPSLPLTPQQSEVHLSESQTHHMASGSSGIRRYELKTTPLLSPGFFPLQLPEQLFQAFTNPSSLPSLFLLSPENKGLIVFNLMVPLPHTQLYLSLCEHYLSKDVLSLSLLIPPFGVLPHISWYRHCLGELVPKMMPSFLYLLLLIPH